MPEQATVDDVLLVADELVLDVQAEADRITREAGRMGLLDVITGPGDLFGFGEQSQNWDALPAQAIAFVDDTYPRLREKAVRTNDLALAQRLVDSAANILVAMTGVGPVDDAAQNAAQVVEDIQSDLEPLAGYPVFVGGGALAGGIVSLSVTGSPRAALGGVVGGAILGGLARWLAEKALARISLGLR